MTSFESFATLLPLVVIIFLVLVLIFVGKKYADDRHAKKKKGKDV
jgi:flagellar biogenesis protein FliO